MVLMKLHQLQVSTVMTVIGQGAPKSTEKSGASSSLGSPLEETSGLGFARRLEVSYLGEGGIWPYFRRCIPVKLTFGMQLQEVGLSFLPDLKKKVKAGCQQEKRSALSNER